MGSTSLEDDCRVVRNVHHTATRHKDHEEAREMQKLTAHSSSFQLPLTFVLTQRLCLKIEKWYKWLLILVFWTCDIYLYKHFLSLYPNF